MAVDIWEITSSVSTVALGGITWYMARATKDMASETKKLAQITADSVKQQNDQWLVEQGSNVNVYSTVLISGNYIPVKVELIAENVGPQIAKDVLFDVISNTKIQDGLVLQGYLQPIPYFKLNEPRTIEIEPAAFIRLNSKPIQISVEWTTMSGEKMSRLYDIDLIAKAPDEYANLRFELDKAKHK